MGYFFVEFGAPNEVGSKKNTSMHDMFCKGGELNNIRLENQKKNLHLLEVKHLPVYCTGFPSCFCIQILLHISSFYNSSIGKIYADVGASLCMKFLKLYIYMCAKKKT